MADESQLRAHPRDWKYPSPVAPGFHTVVSPANSICKATWVFRLNLGEGQTFALHHEALELAGDAVAHPWNGGSAHCRA